MIFRFTLLTSLGIFTSLWMRAQSLDTEKLDQYFDAIEQNDKAMGRVAVFKEDKLIYRRAFGYADMESKIKADFTTLYRIGSITKTMTAAITFKMIESGKLKLDQSLSDFFPSIPNASDILIRHLLAHRSGIHNFTNDEDYLTYYTQPKSQQEMVDLIASKGSDFAPDSKALYSNSNYVLLTFILEKVSGLSYSELVESMLIQPLGLKNTHVCSSIKVSPTAQKSYRFKNGWQLEPTTDCSIPVGAGAIVSNPEDVIIFGQALFSGKIISIEHVTQMKNIQDGYGMGLFTFPFNDKSAYGHDGGIDGYLSNWGTFIEDKISIAYTLNGCNMDPNQIALTLVKAAFDEPISVPEFKSFTHSEEELVKFSGTYASNQMPLKITITHQDGALMAQATGQGAFPLECVAPYTFIFEMAGVEINFQSDENSMTLKQGGMTFSFQKNNN
jgi:D-alanyl-D-alanine carboxypeptidase